MKDVKLKNIFSFYTLLFCALLFILKRDICTAGAQNGMAFCINAVIPSVFPYMAICKMLVKSDCAGQMGSIFTGLICGFPTGAHMCGDMYKSGRVNKRTAQVLCAVSNGMTPTFTIGFVGAYCMKSAQKGVLVYLICSFSALLYAFVSKINLSPTVRKTERMPICDVFTESVCESVLSVLSLCGYVIFFSVVYEFLNALTVLHQPFLPSVISLFSEITTGVFNFAHLGDFLSPRLFFSLVCTAVSFSGICAHLQVSSVCIRSGLSPLYFTAGKFIQSAVSFFVSYIIYGIIFG